MYMRSCDTLKENVYWLSITEIKIHPFKVGQTEQRRLVNKMPFLGPDP